MWSHSRSGSASESPTIAIRLREFGHLTWCSKFGTGASPSSGVSNIDAHCGLVDRDLAARLLAIERPAGSRCGRCVFAWLTAVWMLRKRHFLSCRRRMQPLAAPLLALEDLLDQPLRVRLADDQRLLVVPAVLRHRRPCSDRGRTPGARGGRAAVLARSAERAQHEPAASIPSSSERQRTPSRSALESAAVLARPRPDPARAAARARERLGRAARPAPALQVRADDHPARARTRSRSTATTSRARRCPAGSSASARTSSAPTARSRASTSSTCTTAVLARSTAATRRSPPARRRRSSQLPARLRLPATSRATSWTSTT